MIPTTDVTQPQNAPEVTRVLVADDDPLVRDAYRALLANQEDFKLVGEVLNGREAIDAYEALQPSLVLMDLQMPEVSGIEAIQAISSRWPGACIVALTTFGTRDYIVAALKAGASGYLLKDIGRRNLLAGMRLALQGELPLSSAVRRELVSSIVAEEATPVEAVDVGLTPRERELLVWLAQGLTNHQIGSQMFVSEGSVKQYLSHIGTKLGVKSRTQILIKAIQLNIVNPHELPAIGGI